MEDVIGTRMSIFDCFVESSFCGYSVSKLDTSFTLLGTAALVI
jgi:hypothetical protein